MYSHGFGTLFLAEAYGMTHRPEIREKLQKAVRLIIDTQNNEGGWRYQPVRRDADLSVTDLPDQRPARRAERRAVRAQGDGRGLHPLRASSRRTPTAASATCSRGAPAPSRGRPPGVVALYSAAVYDAKEIEAGVAYLRQYMPEIKLGSRYSHYFYGHYYAAQAMWIRGGDDWNDWYPAIRDELVRRQSRRRASGPTASATSTAPRWR